MANPFPHSVFDFGAWLRAHPWVKRVKVPASDFARYVGQLEADLRITSELPTTLLPCFTWRRVQAAILDSAWRQRRALFPDHLYRKGRS